MSTRQFASVVSVLASLACAFAQDSILVELLGSKYDGLVNLFEHADLLGTLESQVAASRGGVTIFAPTDYHLMHRVSPNVLTFLKQEKNVALLRKTLLNHVTVGKFDSTAWSPVKTVMTLAGSESQLFLDGGELRVDGAVVRELNVLEAGDGVVHAINGFLLPKDVEDAIARDALQLKEVVDAEPDRRMAMAMAPGPAPMINVTAESPSEYSPAAAPGPSAAAPAASAAASAILLKDLAGNPALLALIKSDPKFLMVLTALAAKGPITFLAASVNSFNVTQVMQLGPATVEKILLYNTILGGYSYAQLKAIGSANTPGLAPSPAPSTSRKAAASPGTVQTALGEPLQVTTVGNNVYLGPYPPGVLVSPTPVDNSTNLHVNSVSGLILPPSIVSAPAPAPSIGSTSASSRAVVSVGVLVVAFAAAFATFLL